MPIPIKGGGSNNENGGVDKERKKEGNGGIDRPEEYGFAFSLWCEFVVAGLRYRGVQIKIMRHDRRSQDPDRHVEHRVVVEYFLLRHTAERDRAEIWFRKEDLDPEAHCDHTDQSEYQHLDYAKSAMLQVQNSEYVAGGQTNAPD